MGGLSQRDPSLPVLEMSRLEGPGPQSAPLHGTDTALRLPRSPSRSDVLGITGGLLLRFWFTPCSSPPG